MSLAAKYHFFKENTSPVSLLQKSFRVNNLKLTMYSSPEITLNENPWNKLHTDRSKDVTAYMFNTNSELSAYKCVATFEHVEKWGAINDFFQLVQFPFYIKWKSLLVKFTTIHINPSSLVTEQLHMLYKYNPKTAFFKIQDEHLIWVGDICKGNFWQRLKLKFSSSLRWGPVLRSIFEALHR